MARLNESRIGALLTEAFGATFTVAARSSTHAEHATAVLVGIDADLEVATAAGTVRGRAVVVAPDTPHAATGAGPTLSLSFDPELCPEICGHARQRGAAAIADAHIAGAVHAHRASLAAADTLAGVGAEIARRLTGPVRRPDRRIARLVEELRDPVCDSGQASARTRLSRPHVAALFVRDIGLPMRTFLLWRRLLHGLARVGPLDLTASAHAAGFADLAHFSRTCRRMLGYAPSVLRASLVQG